MKRITLLFGFILSFIISSYGQTIIYVKADAAGGLNNGTSWANAYTSLQTALGAAVSGNQIWVAKGTYKPTNTTDRGISFQLKNGVAIYGGFFGNESLLNQRNYVTNQTILSGDIGTAGYKDDNSYHVINLPNGLGLNTSAVLDGVTIRDGYAVGAIESGAGIYSEYNSFTLSNCTIRDNNADLDGGGICLRYSSSVITNCTIMANGAQFGAGLYSNDAVITITNCTIKDNSNRFVKPLEPFGAGITLIRGNSIVENSIIYNNDGACYGGGIYIEDCSPIVKNCLIFRNDANYGGGVYFKWYGAHPVFYNVTIAHNKCFVNGAGLSTEKGAYGDFYNCIFWGNENYEYLAREIYLDYESVVYLHYSSVYDNHTASIEMEDGSYFNADDNSLCNPSADPLFVDVENDNFHLSPGSPCISSGLNPGENNVPITDLEGRSRPMGSRTDMGAYECNDNASLPVELTSFTAVIVSNEIVLKWKTATEQNNYGFEIQKISLCPPLIKGEAAAAEGDSGCSNWQKIGFVNGAGNSNSPKEYSIIDTNPIQGNAQYRLKQIDLDGNYKYYSQLAEVNFSMTDVKEKQMPKEFGLSQNYPNPFNPTTTIQYQIPDLSPFNKVGDPDKSGEGAGFSRGGFVTLKIYDILGKEVATLVNQQQLPGYYQVTFDAGSLSTGVYLYRITAGSYTSTKKLMLMK